MNPPRDRQSADGQSPVIPRAVSNPPDPEQHKPLTQRLGFRAVCALAPLVAIVLVVSTANKSSPMSSATSGTSSASSASSATSKSTSTTAAPTVPSTSATSSDTDSAAETIGAPGPPTVASTTSAAVAGNTGSLSDDSSTPAGVSAWGTAHSALLGRLRTDVVNLGADATNGELSSLPGDCASLEADLKVAESIPPAPDPSAESLWVQVLGDFTQAISECTNDRDSSAIAEAASETSSGGTVLLALTKQIQARAANS